MKILNSLKRDVEEPQKIHLDEYIELQVGDILIFNNDKESKAVIIETQLGLKVLNVTDDVDTGVDFEVFKPRGIGCSSSLWGIPIGE